MSKHIQLSIADPCHENWDNMTPVAQGKFCGSCQKQVIDFSNMSDREVAQFFKKPSAGSICGRFMQDQLDRSIEIPKKRIPWVKYFFQFALPAFLISMKATAQGKVKVTTTSKVTQVSKCTTTMGLFAPVIIRTEVGDTILRPIQKQDEATPILQGKVKFNTPVSPIKPESQNNFQDTITLPEVVLVSYGEVKKKISMGTPAQVIADSSVPVLPQKEFIGMLGGVSVCRTSRIKVIKDSLVTQVLKKLSPESFKVYPNPVNTGTSIHIEWKQKATGDFMLQLLNVSGQLIFTKQIWIDDKARLLEFQLPSVVAGDYFLRMINKKSGKGYTEKIIIE
jgi:hypothetical protein